MIEKLSKLIEIGNSDIAQVVKMFEFTCISRNENRKGKYAGN